MPAQPREHRRDRRARLLARRDAAQLDFRVLGEQAQELYARVACAADDAHLDHAHAPKNKKAAQKTKKPPGRRLSISRSVSCGSPDQRFEYCLRRLALCSPTFFRSTSRASRVTRPAALSVGFSAASYSIKARAMPWRTAPAWPLSPPPYTFTSLSNPARFFVSSSGWRTTMRPVSRAKNWSIGLPFTTKPPLPGFRNTRATALLRRPVP